MKIKNSNPLFSLYEGYKYFKYLKINDIRELKQKEKNLEKVKNIVLDSFHFFLKLHNKKPKRYKENINILKLQVSNVFFNNWNVKSSKDIDTENISSKIRELVNHSSINSLDIHYFSDYFSHSNDEMIKKFELEETYALVATTIATPFEKSEKFMTIYQYAYLLMMYINLSFYVNYFKIHDNISYFTAKIKILKQMNNLASEIDNIHFNDLNILLNQNMNQIDFAKLEEREK